MKVRLRVWPFHLPLIAGIFKEQFDLDALRDAAFGRYLVGPLKLPTLGRLTDRLVKQLRERVAKPSQ
jgi:hypothetical protein